MSAETASRSNIRERLGLRPIINVSGTMTALGASIAAPEAVTAAAEILPEFVEINDLQRDFLTTVKEATSNLQRLIDDLLDLTRIARGKVRDNYAVGSDRILMVASDRISAFDVVMGEPIPGKGRLLTQMTLFWFERLRHVVPNHLTGEDPVSVVAPDEADQVRGRSMLVRRTEPIRFECVVRGYLSGSGWKDYQKTSSVCGIPLPPGLVESARLPEPIFTPATKAESGHDLNISEEEASRLVGRELVVRAATQPQVGDRGLAAAGDLAAHLVEALRDRGEAGPAGEAAAGDDQGAGEVHEAAALGVHRQPGIDGDLERALQRQVFLGHQRKELVGEGGRRDRDERSQDRGRRGQGPPREGPQGQGHQG